MHWKRWVVIASILIAVVLLIAYGYRRQPAVVEAEAARRGPMQVTVEEEGKTRVTDRYVISAPVSGYLRRSGLEEGDAVRQGQVVAVVGPMRPTLLDPRSRAEAQARVSAAEAAVSRAREVVRAANVDLEYWQKELERAEQLFRSGDLPAQRRDQVATEVRRAEAARASAEKAVAVAEGELRTARAALQHAGLPQQSTTETVTVRAPVSGRVLKLVRESEGIVNSGEPLVEIGNAQSLEVEVEVLSADAVRIQPGTRVVLTRWGGDQPLEGRVRRVEPLARTKVSALGVEEQRAPVIVDITSPRELWERLGAGYRVEASFILWESPNVLQVPASSLFRSGEGWVVFTVENGVARRKPVQVGRRNGLVAEITSGLQSGERVITHPDSTVEDGKRVEVRAA